MQHHRAVVTHKCHADPTEMEDTPHETKSKAAPALSKWVTALVMVLYVGYELLGGVGQAAGAVVVVCTVAPSVQSAG